MRVRIICTGSFRVSLNDGEDTVFEAEAKNFDYELDQTVSEGELRLIYESLTEMVSTLLDGGNVPSEDAQEHQAKVDLSGLVRDIY